MDLWGENAALKPDAEFNPKYVPAGGACKFARAGGRFCGL